MTLQTIQGTVQTPRFHSFAVAGLALACGQAMAMNGAQLGGYGIKNAGMGGASIALPLDASAAANNPAGMAFVPTSVVGSVVVFNGKSSPTFGGIPGLAPSNQLNDNTTQAGPEGGFNWVVNSQMTVGLTLSGAGAGADYGEPLVPFPGLKNLKSSQKVADVIPSISWKINPNLAVGLGVIFAFQEFESQGVFNPVFGALPNHGKEKATGVGARIGLQWNATPELSVGATYKSRTPMSKLGKYGDDLLAYSGGKVDIPAEYGVGLAWKATPSLTLAADFLEVKYSKVKVMEDPNGQKWKDQPILRLGAAWEMNPTWTLRGGLSRNQRQITSDRTSQNLLSPAINNVAYTFGASMKLDPKSDINFSMELNPSKTLNGTGESLGTNITSKTQVIRVGYQKQF